jgi:hypothetical protein
MIRLRMSKSKKYLRKEDSDKSFQLVKDLFKGFSQHKYSPNLPKHQVLRQENSRKTAISVYFHGSATKFKTENRR